MKRLLAATMLYVIVIFPITALWHVGLFKEFYLDCGYFNQEETLLAGIAGLLNIVVQGGVLAILYSRTQFSGSHLVRGLKFSGLIFVFYFTLQVVNFVVRKQINALPLFVLMELIYMVIQFSVYGVLMGLLHGRKSALSGKQLA